MKKSTTNTINSEKKQLLKKYIEKVNIDKNDNISFKEVISETKSFGENNLYPFNTKYHLERYNKETDNYTILQSFPTFESAYSWILIYAIETLEGIEKEGVNDGKVYR